MTMAKSPEDKTYIFWSCDPRRLDSQDPWIAAWRLKQVLTYGRLEDLSDLNFDEIRSALPRLDLRPEIRRFWEDYFEWRAHNP